MADGYGAASKKPGMFHDNGGEIKAQMPRALRPSGDVGLPLRRLVTI